MKDVRRAKQVEQSPFGAQVAFRRATIGAMALGALAVGATAIGALAIGALAIRALARQARKDRAPQHRGARGWQAARKGAGRRARANPTPRRIGSSPREQ